MRHVTLRAAAAIASLCLLAGAAAEAGPDQLDLRYDLLSKKMRVFDIRLQTSVGAGAYSSEATLSPQGLASLFMDTEIVMSSRGRLGKKIDPQRSQMSIKSEGEMKSYEVLWGAKTKPLAERSAPLKPERQAAVEAALKPGLADPLAALLRAGLPPDRPCDRVERVYNGREIYDLEFGPATDSKVGKGAGVYRGPAVRCRMVYRMVAGQSEKSIRKNRAAPPAFDLWLAPVSSPSLGRQLYVLVGLSGEVDGRNFSAHLTAATINGQPLNGQSIARR